jgi:hypothetical protein
VVSIVQRLEGCPSGATRDALLLNGHTSEEIEAALDAGLIRSEIYDYAKPRNFEVEWLFVGE